jgi:hypothetical protein
MNIRAFTKVAVAVFSVFGIVYLAHASKRIPPSSMPELSAAWVGWADSMHYFRLELKADGTGICALYQRSRSDSRLYQVTKWTLKDYDIEITLKPIDADAWPVTMKGTAISSALRLQLGDGRKNGWRAKTTFERESVIESAMESAKRRMQDFSKSEITK